MLIYFTCTSLSASKGIFYTFRFLNATERKRVKEFNYNQQFELEAGGYLPELKIAYHTYGKLNEAKSNVVWVSHALTANSDPVEWWPGLFGHGYYFDPEKYFIICANIIGSCYGSTGPLDLNPETDMPYYYNFPKLTLRDMVRAHILLRKHLEIEKIHIGIGGSMGGHQLLEWSVMEPGVFERQILMATAARESAWSIAIHTTQRGAIETDNTWGKPIPHAGEKGLKVARGIGLVTYRHSNTYIKAQTDDDNKLDDFKASSYIHYQGEKLVKRGFNAYSYWFLVKAMDTHHIGRGRGKIEEVLKQIKAKTLVIGFDTDLLLPVTEQQFLADNIPGAALKVISSDYGHDSFLIETEVITDYIKEFMTNKIQVQ